MIDYKMHTGPWNLTDLKNIPKNGLNVFSCFHGGGGSTMGYKLAGYDVLGGVEIDPKMMKVYRANHHPTHSYLMGVSEFNAIPEDELPSELFELDILDGSPPCSSFSSTGARQKKWQVKKKFREGQAEQILDTLFFDFVRTAEKLKPKILVAENVKGLIQGKAKGYVKEINQKLQDAGYDVQLFLLNAAFMGVPQIRERTFFIARRRDLGLPKISLNFSEKPIAVKDSVDFIEEKNNLTAETYKLWMQTPPGQSLSYAHPRGSRFTEQKLSRDRPSFTLRAQKTCIYHWSQPRTINHHEASRIQAFPDDFDFLDQQPNYVCGMSVPPFMTERIANQIYKQWLSKP